MDFELEGSRFNWRDEKASTNASKHGVTFFEAAEALVDPGQCMDEDLEHSEPGHRRFTGIGLTKELRLLRVTFREMQGNVTHVISAREANPIERRRYARTNR